MQPTQAETDPTQWAGGELQPSSQPAENHGSAASPKGQAVDADTADSDMSTGIASVTQSAAVAHGSNGSPASTGGVKQGDGEGDQEMQLEGETELESSVLGTGGGLTCTAGDHIPLQHVAVLIPSNSKH